MIRCECCCGLVSWQSLGLDICLVCSPVESLLAASCGIKVGYEKSGAKMKCRRAAPVEDRCPKHTGNLTMLCYGVVFGCSSIQCLIRQTSMIAHSIATQT